MGHNILSIRNSKYNDIGRIKVRKKWEKIYYANHNPKKQ